MAGDIKGITIEFRGNATPLNKTIREVNSNIRKTQNELSSIKRALKFTPTSVDMWRQKQQLLKQQIKQTEADLKDLKAALKQMDAAGVDKNSEGYRRLQREIVETESKLKTFKAQYREIGNANLRALGEGFQVVGKKIEGAGQKLRGLSAAAGVAAASIAALTAKSATAADDINTLSKKYSIGTKELQMYSAAAELVDVDVNTIAKSHVRLEKNMLSAKDGTGTAADAFKALGVEVTNADGSLREGDAVWQDTIKALGTMENETERDAYAMQLMGKSASELNPLIEDGGEAYANLAKTMQKYGLDFLDQETLDKANEFQDELDTIKAMGSVAFLTIGSKLAAYLAPALEKAVDLVGRFANWLSNLDPRILAVVAAIAGVLAVLAPALIFIGKLATGIGAVIKVVGMVTGALAALSPVVLIVIGVIAALVAAGIYLYKHWDTIKAKASELWNHITTVFTNIQTAITAKINAIKAFLTSAWATIKAVAASAFQALYSYMTNPIQTAFNVIKGVVNKLKSIFPLKIGKVFSGLKLPHFKVSGGKAPWGIGGKGSLPKWSVDWYKKGGIFDSPSIIGVGEAGSEAVVPLDKFWDKLDNIQGETNIVININGADASPTEIANEVKRMLIKETNQRRLAWQ